MGSYSYEVIDTKNSSKVKKNIYIKFLYSYLLKEVQGILPKIFIFYLKIKKEAYQTKDVFNTFLLHKKNFENFIKKDSNKKTRKN